MYNCTKTKIRPNLVGFNLKRTVFYFPAAIKFNAEPALNHSI